MSSYICHQTQTQFKTKLLTKYKRTNQVHTCGIQPFKKIEVTWSVNGCIRQIPLGPFLNTLSRMGQGIQEWTK